MPKYECTVETAHTYIYVVDAKSEQEAEAIAFDTELESISSEQTYYDCSVKELPEVVVPFTYPALPDDAPQDLKDAYTVFEKYLKASIELPGITETNKEVIRKQSDTTKITKEQYDEILLNYKHYKQGMLLGVNSSQKLTEHLNKLLGLNKSRSVYSKIWCGGVDRESLPIG